MMNASVSDAVCYVVVIISCYSVISLWDCHSSWKVSWGIFTPG